MLTATTSYRLGIAVAVGTSAFLVLGAGALGIIADGGRPDLMYLGVLAVGVVGSAIARLRPRGMAYALAVTAAGPLVVAVIALAADLHEGEVGYAVDIVGLSGMYAALFALSAWLFWRGAEQQTHPAR